MKPIYYTFLSEVSAADVSCDSILGSSGAVGGVTMAFVILFCTCGCCYMVERSKGVNTDGVCGFLLLVFRGILLLMMGVGIMIPLFLSSVFYATCDQKAEFNLLFGLQMSIVGALLLVAAYYGCFAYLLHTCRKK